MSGGNNLGGFGEPEESRRSIGEPDFLAPKTHRLENVAFTESDVGRLAPFETDVPPQYLVEKGLITPFEFAPPGLERRGGQLGSGRIKYQSPSEFATAHGGYEYDDPRLLQGGDFDPQDLKPVENWMAEMEAARENQYFQWQTDFGHFLGGAGTRLASRFDTEEAKVKKQTLLPGEGIV